MRTPLEVQLACPPSNPAAAPGHAVLAERRLWDGLQASLLGLLEHKLVDSQGHRLCRPLQGGGAGKAETVKAHRTAHSERGSFMRALLPRIMHTLAALRTSMLHMAWPQRPLLAQP